MRTLYDDTLLKIQTLIRSCRMGNDAIAGECGVDVPTVAAIARGEKVATVLRPADMPVVVRKEQLRPLPTISVEAPKRCIAPKYLPSEAEIAAECELIRARRLAEMV